MGIKAIYVSEIISCGFTGKGTYHLYFVNDNNDCDRTEFYACDCDDLLAIWFEFCTDNNLDAGCLTMCEFVCSEFI